MAEQALEDLFKHDRSAARREISTRGFCIFADGGERGNAHAHALFNCISTGMKADVPRTFYDCEVSVDETGMPHAVKPTWLNCPCSRQTSVYR